MLASPLYSFEPWVVTGAPDDPGLYALYKDSELLCLGVALGRAGDDTIRGQLLALMDHREQLGRPTHYRWEITRQPAVARDSYLRALGRETALCEEWAREQIKN